MTTALYRRYRPDTFQEVIGQDHVTAPLMAALRGDRVTHAYLFSGPRGCGKTTSARILARCLNCERFPTDTPCGTCPSCRDLATGGPGSLDVVEIDAASHNGVDDARDLRERASFAPARDRYKIFILDEAHMVTTQGFNALLKLVEEPPAHVKFIFATTEPEKVIGTIRSRTHHYPFRLVPPDVLEGYLGHLCGSEGVGIGPGVFPLVVRAGGGSVRDTLSVMDQLIGGAVDGEVDYTRAVALLGYTDTTMLDQCVDAIAAGDGAGVFRVVDRVITSGHDPRRFVEDLLQRLRDLLVIALAGAEAGPALGSMPTDQLSRMEVQARTVGAAGLSRAADMTAQALGQMVGATSPRLQLELLMARLLVPTQRHAAGSAVPVAPAAGVGQAGAPGSATSSGAAGARSASAGGPAAAPPAEPGDGHASGQGRARASQIARRAAEQAAAREDRDGVGPGRGRGSADGPATRSEADWRGEADWDAVEPGRGSSATAPTEASASTAHPSVPAGTAASPASWGPAGPSAAAGPARPSAPWEPASPPGAAGPGGQPVPAAPSGGRRVTDAPATTLDKPADPAPPDGQVPPGGRPVPHAGAEDRGDAADAEMIRTRWEEVLDAAKRSRRATWALVGPNSQPGGIVGGVFEVLFTAQGLVNAFENGGHGPILARAIHQALGLGLEVHAVLVTPGGPRGGSPGPGANGAQEPAARPSWHEATPRDAHGGPRTGATSAASESPSARAPHKNATGSVGEPPRAEMPHASAAGPSPDAGPAPEAGFDDGWGEVALPGGGRAASSSPAHRGQSTSTRTVASEPGNAVPVSPVRHQGASPARTPESSHAEPGAGSAGEAPGPSTPQGVETPTSPGPGYPGQAVARPGGPEVLPDEGQERAPLATVHRLRALPDLPDPAPTAPRGGLSPASWDGPETFSDGIPLPEEPGDPDGPGDVWTPGSRDRLSAAQAAARAAARGDGPGRFAAPTPGSPSLEEDLPSEDDEDAEEAGVVGLEVVKRLLGATVVEEITVTQEGR